MVRIENPWLVGRRKMEAQTFLGIFLSLKGTWFWHYGSSSVKFKLNVIYHPKDLVVWQLKRLPLEIQIKVIHKQLTCNTVTIMWGANENQYDFPHCDPKSRVEGEPII